jgi:ubiquinol oxidase
MHSSSSSSSASLRLSYANMDSTHPEAAHVVPTGFSDHIAYALVRFARVIADVFFAHRYGHRAVVLETVAAVPGMVGALFQHLSALRRIADDKGRIQTLLDEAQNERMHLMVYVSVAQPSFAEHVFIICAQIVFFVVYFCIYIVSSRTAHRAVGYLEEEAIKSYSLYLDEIDRGVLPNTPAPLLAISYWHLPPEAITTSPTR